jgi:hypothetical protein
VTLARRNSTFLVLLGLAGCTDGPTTPTATDDTNDTSLERAGVVSAIVEAEQGGAPGFYFLPPLVAAPDSTGPFDGSLLDVVSIEICALDGDDCAGDPVAVFTGTSGGGSESIRVDEENEHYIVNWHTKRFDVETDQAYRIRIVANAIEQAYADLWVHPKGGKPVADDGRPGIRYGRTLPIKFRVDSGAVIEALASVEEQHDLKPLVLGLGVSVQPSAAVVVDYWTPDGPRLRVERSTSTEHALVLPRLLPASPYEYEVTFTFDDPTRSVDPISGSWETDPLPDDLEAIALTSTGQSTAPLTMLELREPTFQGFAAVDAIGRVVWYHRTDGASWGWTRRSNGNFVFLDTQGGLNEVTPTGDVVATLTRANGEVIHHDVIATPQNTLYFMTRHPQAVDGVTWTGEIIWEWDPDSGDLDARWNAFDFLSPATDTTDRSRTSDWLHGNSLDIGASGTVLLSSPWLNQVIAIPGDFSGIAWRLGGKNATIFTDSAGAFDFQHTAAEIQEGRVLLFDNRGGEVDGQPVSRALELELDFETDSAATVWTFQAPNDNYASIISSARRMENGNTMVAFGPSDGWRDSRGPIEVYEVQSDGTVVWNLVVEGPNHMYRATPFVSLAGEVEVDD